MEAKPIWQSRIFWVNFLSTLFAILEMAGVIDVVSGEEIETLALGIVALVNIFLRARTNQPVKIR